jgi:hypothetical protein
VTSSPPPSARSPKTPSSAHEEPRGYLRDLADANDQTFFGRNVTLDILPGGLSTGRKYEEAAAALEGIDLNSLNATSGKAALDVLKARGKDPSKGQVALDGRISQRSARLSKIERALTWHPSSRRSTIRSCESRFCATTPATSHATLRASLGDFGGKAFTPEAVGGFLDNATALAGAAGEETALLTGDELAGAGQTTDDLRAAAAKVQAELASNTDINSHQRAAIIQRLKAFGLVIAQSEAAEAQQMVARAAAIGELRQSQLGRDDRVGRGAIALSTLREQLGSTTNVNERTRLQAQINEGQSQQAIEQLNARQANDLAGIDPRNNFARITTQRDQAVERLGTLTEGSQEYGQLSQQIADYDNQVLQYSLDYFAALDLNNVAVGDTVGEARAAYGDAQRRLQDARAGGDPTAIQQPRGVSRPRARLTSTPRSSASSPPAARGSPSATTSQRPTRRSATRNCRSRTSAATRPVASSWKRRRSSSAKPPSTPRYAATWRAKGSTSTPETASPGPGRTCGTPDGSSPTSAGTSRAGTSSGPSSGGSSWKIPAHRAGTPAGAAHRRCGRPRLRRRAQRRRARQRP